MPLYCFHVDGGVDDHSLQAPFEIGNGPKLNLFHLCHVFLLVISHRNKKEEDLIKTSL